MGRGLEVARFRVHAESEDAFLAGRAAAIGALRREFPELVDERLARGDDGVWIHVLTWETPEAARRAQQRAPEVPELGAWFAHMSDFVGMEHGELVE